MTNEHSLEIGMQELYEAMNLFNILLVAHIVCGGISLILGLFVLILRKGDYRHQIIGKFFFYCMLLAALIALPMSCLHPNYFLFIVAVFTSYMLLSGVRYLRIKDLNDVKLVDWMLSSAMFCFGVVFIVMGSAFLLKSNLFGVVLLVFGFISLIFVYQDYVNFKGKSSVQNFWLITHIQRMTVSYIASATAFLVVNNTYLPGILAWLFPTILLTPIIVVWSRRRAIKMNG